ncbi:DUF6153 family protein [Streptomyces sp. NPDC004647]|uniref:DUF6153 family protein n=1 Tax=Streptomyces sp. NPDC004647 TaxID=3154671 RepID=UPI0033BD7703
MLPGMVAARPILSALRSRSPAAGPWRTWVLAALLLALMYTHGVSGESAAGHAHTGASSSVTLDAQEAAAAGHSHDGPGSHSSQRHIDHHEAPEPDHAAHQCVSGQPEQGVALPAPCEAPLAAVPPTHAYVPTASRPAAAFGVPPPLPDSTVLRI